MTEKIAQETSCLDQKRFKAALNTVRNALADQLDKRRNDRISYKGLCSQYGIDDTAVRWMEQVEKEARSGGHLSHVKTSKKNIICAVFYWTCIKLNVSDHCGPHLGILISLDVRFVLSKVVLS